MRLGFARKAYFIGANFFSWLDYKDSKTTQLDSLTALQRILERIEDRFHRNFRFDLGDIQLLCNTVYDVLLYHAGPPIS
jgi:hypothetical protein